MKTLDHDGIEICRMQGALFSASRENSLCSSPVFIRRFMGSALARRMDDGSILSEASSMPRMIQEVEDEYGKSSYGSTKYSDSELYWIGYVYRYWCYCFEETSAHVFRNVGGRDMRLLYGPYHSLDPAQAIRRIAEEKGLCLDVDSKALRKRGVEALRTIRAKVNFDYYVAKL